MLVFSKLLQADIVFQEFYFLLDGYGTRIAVVQLVTKHIGELHQRLPGVCVFLIYQKVNGIERVEQEMRVDLRFQEIEFGLCLFFSHLPQPALRTGIIHQQFESRTRGYQQEMRYYIVIYPYLEAVPDIETA